MESVDRTGPATPTTTEMSAKAPVLQMDALKALDWVDAQNRSNRDYLDKLLSWFLRLVSAVIAFLLIIIGYFQLQQRDAVNRAIEDTQKRVEGEVSKALTQENIQRAVIAALEKKTEAEWQGAIDRAVRNELNEPKWASLRAAYERLRLNLEPKAMLTELSRDLDRLTPVMDKCKQDKAEGCLDQVAKQWRAFVSKVSEMTPKLREAGLSREVQLLEQQVAGHDRVIEDAISRREPGAFPVLAIIRNTLDQAIIRN